MARRPDVPMFAQLGPVLRRLRLARRRTQVQVAIAAEIPVASLSRYETGAVLPSLAKLAAILTALDLPLARVVEELTPPSARPRPAPAPEDEDVAPETLVVADLLLGGADDLSPEAREVFTDLVDDVYHLSRLMQQPRDGRKGGGDHR